MKKFVFEIWALFENGMEVKVETRKSLKSAQAAIDAMDRANLNDIAEGYGFPYGVPAYIIR